MEYIGETWWQIILDFGAKITVKNAGKTKQAVIPPDFVLPKKDDKVHLVQIEKNKKQSFAGHLATIKNLCIVYKQPPTLDKRMMSGAKRQIERRKIAQRGSIPDYLQGISIQRGGMKIANVNLKYVPQSISGSIYGYIDFDGKTEKLLQKHESPEHYSFDKSLLPRAVSQYIEAKLIEFAIKKLHYQGQEAIKDIIQKEAEKKALKEINRIVSELKIFGSGKDTFENDDEHTHVIICPPVKKELVRLEMETLPLPGEGKRVDYGEKIDSFEVKAINESEKPINVRIRLSHWLGKTTNKETFTEQDFTINAGKKTGVVFPKWTCKAGEEKGCHAFRAEMISLMPDNKGTYLDVLNKYFWVEEDPPAPGIFGKIEGVTFPKEYSDSQGYSAPLAPNGYSYMYNLDHPAKKAAEDELQNYLVEILAREISIINLKEKQNLFTKEELDDPTKIIQKSNEIIGKILHAYY